MNPSDLFSAAFLRQAAQELQAMIDAAVGIRTAVLATVDGFAVASAQTDGSDSARMAALASSIASIASVATQEAGLGRCASVTLNTDQGFAVVRQLRRDGHDLVMIGISDGQALLAQVMYQANQFARRLESA